MSGPDPPPLPSRPPSSSQPPPPPPPPPQQSLFHALGQWVSSTATDARGWTERAADERRRYLAGVASGTLTAGGGHELGDNPAAEEANRLRSAASAADQRAWSLDPAERRSYMLNAIRRSPVASRTSDVGGPCAQCGRGQHGRWLSKGVCCCRDWWQATPVREDVPLSGSAAFVYLQSVRYTL